MINTNTLFPRSAMAALAKKSSPKNSKTKGKQESPGAKEGIRSLAVRYELESFLIPTHCKRKGAILYS